MSTINEKIKEIRKQNGWTQAYMAKRLGISQPAYQKIETGDTDSMRVSTLRNICKEFNLSADQILGIDTTIAAKRVGDTTHLRKVARGRQLASAGLKPAKAKVTTEGKKHKYEIKG